MPPINSTVVRALNSFGLENLSRRNSLTSNSQPSSPLKKEGFVFPPEGIQSQALVRRMDRMLMERNQITETNKEENTRSESKPITSQTQLISSPEMLPTGDEDLVECDQQSNGSPCQTHKGGLHMPDSASFKEFIFSVRTRRRYHSQCTPEKTMCFIGQSTGSSPNEGSDFSSLNVRRANSCPEIKKTNGNTISSSTTPLQEESEDDHGDNSNISNGHSYLHRKNSCNTENKVTKARSISTQTENILPYEHLFYCLFPAYNDSNNCNKNHQSSPHYREDESLGLIEKYVRTSAIVQNHRQTAASCDDVKLLKDQVSLLALQLQFERNRREVHAERNRRLLGKSRTSRALDEHNSALKDQVLMLQTELENVTSEFEKHRQYTRNQINELKDSVSHWQTECSMYQEETKEANNNYKALEQLYNGERLKTSEVTKQLSATKADLFNTESELNIVRAAADKSKELENTVTILQRELNISGEIQSRQRDIVRHVNSLKHDATKAMLSQNSYKHHTMKLQEKLDRKTAQLEASNARIVELELRLMTKDTSVQNEKREIERVKEQCNKQIAGLEEECRILKEMQCRYHESRLEEIGREECADGLMKFNPDLVTVTVNSPISSKGAEFRLNMMMAKNDDESDDNQETATSSK